MSKTRFTILALGLALAVGCGNGKKAKCEKGWDQAKELMNAFGGDKKDEIAAKMDAMKGMYMEKCTSLPDDVVDCIADGVAMDKSCKKKLKDAGMAGLKNSMDDDDDAPMKKKAGKKDDATDEKKE